MKIGIPKEIAAGETRVAVNPAGVALLKKQGYEVLIQSGAGTSAKCMDDQYEKAGAVVVGRASDVYGAADLVLKVRPPEANADLGKHEADFLREGSILIGFLAPFSNLDLMRRLADRKITGFSMEFIPRITRAQSMDSLSSMATLSGYKMAVMAAERLDSIFPLMMTAAGTLSAANVLVLGAGVAGLQAIATAKRLGARVEAFDPRPAVKDQVQSVGAQFVEMPVVEEVETAGGYAKEQSDDFLRREQEVIGVRLGRTDVVLTTAAIFGKRAPVLITEAMVQRMRAGSIIIDLAAEQGGNCELTEAGKEIVRHGVLIVGAVNLPALLPVPASQMYSKNITNLVDHLYQGGQGALDFEDQITREACLTRDGQIVNEMIRNLVEKGATGQ